MGLSVQSGNLLEVQSIFWMPTNPQQQISDIPLFLDQIKCIFFSISEIAEIARANGALLMVDNSIMSPVLCRPLELGADIVMNAATKFVAAHSDVMAGVLSIKGERLGEELDFQQNSEGAGLAPFDCCICLRGIKTMALRVERQQDKFCKSSMKNKTTTTPRNDVLENGRKKYEKWSYEEEEALLRGIEQYGFGSWQAILEDPEFGFYLFTRSERDLRRKTYMENRIMALKEKCLKPGIEKRLEPLRRNDLMQPFPLGPSSSKIRSKKVIENDSDSEEYEHQYTFTSKRRGTCSNTVKEAMKSNSEGVLDDLLHQSPLSSEESSKDESVEELSDFEDCDHQCTVTPQRRGIHKNSINQAKKSKSLKDLHNLHQSPVSGEESSKMELVEEIGDSEDYQIPHTIPRHIRRTRNNMRNQTRRLDSNEVHDYLEYLWGNFPEDKRNLFAHIDPLWNHWSVLIFCHFGECLESKEKTPCILLLDSLEKTDHSKQLEPIIRRFVSDLYESLEMTEDIKMLRKMPFLVPKVPQQRDGDECGYFVLYYIKLFLQNAPENFSVSDGYPYFMKKDWFTFEELDSFCKVFDSSHK